MYTEAELRAIGFECLQQKLGVVDTERFIASILRNAGNYTIERREIFDGMSIEDVRRETSAYCKEHPLSEEARRRSDMYKAEHGGNGDM